MELLYTVSEKRNTDDLQNSSLHDEGGACIVSCQSIVAFTRKVIRQDNFRHRIPVYNVCVSDLNCPHEPHIILESPNRITDLEFSADGNQLLVVRSLGMVHLFTKGQGLQEWTSTHISDWGGEEILHISFFHQGIRTTVSGSEGKNLVTYMEKFTSLPHKPTLVNIGQSAYNGFFAVTVSGLICVCVLGHDGELIVEKKVVLGQTRDNFTVATAALAPSGHIHIATWKPEMIKCWRIELKFAEGDGKSVSNDLNINIQSAQSFCPSRSGSYPASQRTGVTVQVTCLQYTEAEDPNSLLVACTAETANDAQHQGGATTELRSSSPITHLVQRYQLQEKQLPLLKLFMQSETNGLTTKEWVCVSEWIAPSQVVRMATVRRHLLSSQMPLIITAATSDATIYSINKETMQQMGQYSLHASPRVGGDEPPRVKRLAMQAGVQCLAHTWTGFGVIVMDTHANIRVLSLINLAHSWVIQVIQLLMEYALVSGNDWWDLLVMIPNSSNTVITVIDKLMDIFNQHSPALTQHLMIRFLVLRNSLYRLIGGLQQKAVETRVHVQLTAIQHLFRALRPLDVSNSEKNIASTIQEYLVSRNSLDNPDLEKAVEHLCVSLNIRDCQVDPGLLQHLQPLLQFSTDLALFIMFMIGQNGKFELARDHKIVQALREILFVSRLWYRQNKLVQPQLYRKAESVDVWAHIYKLLTRIAERLPAEPDASIIDECVLLETQVVCRELPLHIAPRGVLGQLASGMQPPFTFEFGQSDNSTNLTGSSGIGNNRVLEGALPPLPHLDPLHYHYLGQQESKLQCTRCYGNRGWWWGDGEIRWEQQWASHCVCSGHWAPMQQPATKAA